MTKDLRLAAVTVSRIVKKNIINFVQTKQKNSWAEEKTGGIKQIQCVIDHLFFFLRVE